MGEGRRGLVEVPTENKDAVLVKDASTEEGVGGTVHYPSDRFKFLPTDEGKRGDEHCRKKSCAFLNSVQLAAAGPAEYLEQGATRADVRGEGRTVEAWHLGKPKKV